MKPVDPALAVETAAVRLSKTLGTLETLMAEAIAATRAGRNALGMTAARDIASIAANVNTLNESLITIAGTLRREAINRGWKPPAGAP